MPSGALEGGATSRTPDTASQAHLNWLASQKFEYPEHRLVFEEKMMAMRQAQERLERLAQATGHWQIWSLR